MEIPPFEITDCTVLRRCDENEAVKLGDNGGMEIFETPLPGVGIRYEFDTQHERRIGVLVHRDGRRELLVYRKSDPDACSEMLQLTHDESASLVELLGGSKVTERLSDLRHEVEGLSIEWVSLSETSPLAGKTIGEGRVRTVTGASVIAVIRNGNSFPGPGPDFLLVTGDVVLLSGSSDGVEAARRIVAG